MKRLYKSKTKKEQRELSPKEFYAQFPFTYYCKMCNTTSKQDILYNADKAQLVDSVIIGVCTDCYKELKTATDNLISAIKGIYKW